MNKAQAEIDAALDRIKAVHGIPFTWATAQYVRTLIFMRAEKLALSQTAYSEVGDIFAELIGRFCVDNSIDPKLLRDVAFRLLRHNDILVGEMLEEAHGLQITDDLRDALKTIAAQK